MFGGYLHQLIEVDSREVDQLAAILQHRDRPKANRTNDQIYMLVGSQLVQARLIAPYLQNQRAIFMGDGDCMSLAILALASEGIVDPPRHITVLDFDKRLLGFLEDMRSKLGWHEDRFECHCYNVKDPVPTELSEKGEIFYTNPPYGYYNDGFSSCVFLGRASELCAGVSQGIAILPYDKDVERSKRAMTKTQEFMSNLGYIVSEMLLGQHRYDLDDRPNLTSGTIVFDRIENREAAAFAGRPLAEDEMTNFYGRSNEGIPDYIDHDNIDGNA